MDHALVERRAEKKNPFIPKSEFADVTACFLVFCGGLEPSCISLPVLVIRHNCERFPGSYHIFNQYKYKTSMVLFSPPVYSLWYSERLLGLREHQVPVHDPDSCQHVPLYDVCQYHYLTWSER